MSLSEQIQEFETLVAQHHILTDQKQAIEQRQSDIAEEIAKRFETVVAFHGFLSKVKWEVTVPGRYVLTGDEDDEAFQKLLNVVVWNDSHRHFHHFKLDIGGKFLYVNDGVLHFSFDSAEELSAFCKKHGITPDKTKMQEQQAEFQEKADSLTSIMESLP